MENLLCSGWLIMADLILFILSFFNLLCFIHDEQRNVTDSFMISVFLLSLLFVIALMVAVIFFPF